MIKHFCDVCNNLIERSFISQKLTVEKQLGGHLFNADVIVSEDNITNNGDLCGKCLLSLILSAPEFKKGRGPDRKKRMSINSKPTAEGGSGGQGVASEPLGVVPTTPKKKGGRKQRSDRRVGKTEDQLINPNVCEPGKPERTFCLGFPEGTCPERKVCTLDGAAALDCLDKRYK